jgi:hypothetical protein
MSSISRAFTLRSKRNKDKETSTPPVPLRSASMRYSGKPVDIRTISSPVALLSTTNMLSYNAPDVSSVRAQRKASTSVSSGSSSRSSADESDTSTISYTSHDTTLTDVSSIASSSPISSPDSKDRLSYFPSSKTLSLSPPIPPRISRSISTSELRPSSSLLLDSEPGSSPEIPQRAPSHSKKAHEVLARKRSLQTMSRTNSVSSITSTSREKRNSIEFFSRNITDAPAPSLPTFGFSPSPSLSNSPHTSHHQSSHSHPFGKELMQLDEIAEEFGGAVRDAEREGDIRAMRLKGLQRFCAEDYMREIQSLLGGFLSPYPSHVQQQEVAWI